MMLRDVIKSTVRQHLLENQGICMGQCLTAVGWVGGTLPELYEEDGMIELSMADVAGGGFAVGAALAGKRPIYVIRYQGFNWFNAPIILNYACKSKELWGRPCPMMIRSIAMEGAIGPVAGSSHHSLYYRMPGIVITAPMTPGEYTDAYRRFMSNDDVYYFSEHRGAYTNERELEDELIDGPSELTIAAISITRFAAKEACEHLRKSGLSVNFVNLVQLKPLELSENVWESLRQTKKVLVIDDDYPSGAASAIAQLIHEKSGAHTRVLGLEERSAGFAPHLDNLPPNKDKIIEAACKKTPLSEHIQW